MNFIEHLRCSHV